MMTAEQIIEMGARQGAPFADVSDLAEEVGFGVPVMLTGRLASALVNVKTPTDDELIGQLTDVLATSLITLIMTPMGNSVAFAAGGLDLRAVVGRTLTGGQCVTIGLPTDF